MGGYPSLNRFFPNHPVKKQVTVNPIHVPIVIINWLYSSSKMIKSSWCMPVIGWIKSMYISCFSGCDGCERNMLCNRIMIGCNIWYDKNVTSMVDILHSNAKANETNTVLLYGSDCKRVVVDIMSGDDDSVALSSSLKLILFSLYEW